jgi:hypothetical protein
MTTTAPETGTGTVTRYWETGLIITRASIAGLITSDPGDTGHEDGSAARSSIPAQRQASHWPPSAGRSSLR